MTDSFTQYIEAALLERNAIAGAFFNREASRMAEACRQMSERFLAGGRLLAFGRGPYATDAQHVAVEFVHPVMVGKRALPALDLSMAFESWLEVLLEPQDMVMGFAPSQGDAVIDAALRAAGARGALTFALTGHEGDYAVEVPTAHPFIHQEVLELLYHLLWETVHVFFEHRERDYPLAETAFLYPFLSGNKQDIQALVGQVGESIQMKVQEDAELRRALLAQQDAITEAARAIAVRLGNGGRLVLFGNGGSATDANDLMLDCTRPPFSWRAVPAVSLALEPASISAIANDVGSEVVFLRQMMALARPQDVAMAFSTSGGSKNIVLALQEARKQGMLTIALLGYDGGEVLRQGLADVAIVVPSEHIPRIQEVQASVYHIIRELLGFLWR